MNFAVRILYLDIGLSVCCTNKFKIDVGIFFFFYKMIYKIVHIKQDKDLSRNVTKIPNHAERSKTQIAIFRHRLAFFLLPILWSFVL